VTFISGIVVLVAALVAYRASWAADGLVWHTDPPYPEGYGYSQSRANTWEDNANYGGSWAQATAKPESPDGNTWSYGYTHELDAVIVVSSGSEELHPDTYRGNVVCGDDWVWLPYPHFVWRCSAVTHTIGVYGYFPTYGYGTSQGTLGPYYGSYAESYH